MTGKKTDNEIKVCPKCGSINLGSDASLGGASDYCNDCGYNNPKNGAVLVMNFPTKNVNEKVEEKEKKDFEKKVQELEEKMKKVGDSPIYLLSPKEGYHYECAECGSANVDPAESGAMTGSRGCKMCKSINLKLVKDKE